MKFKDFKNLLLSLLLIIAVLLSPLAAAATTGNMEWPNPGAIKLNKTAALVSGTDNQWKISLTIEGKNIQKTSDVVLVIDKSGSMNDDGKMANTKAAAKKFADELLFADGLTRIAVVSFDQNPHLVRNFTNYSGKNDLCNDIDNIQAEGGTNLQGGIRQAQLLLAPSQADNKAMVLLSDGGPTYSYHVTGASGITLAEQSDFWIPLDVVYNNPQITAIDYTSIVGNGAIYSLLSNSHYTYQIPCPKHNSHPTIFPADNGVATIYEAGLAKSTGTKVYSIALGADSFGQDVLDKCQNTKYYSIGTDLSSLNTAFAEIAGSIAYAASNGIVTDPLGDEFDLVNGTVQITQGTVEVSSDNRIISWKAGQITEGSQAGMTYTVKIKDTANPNTLYPANKTTTFAYKDINNNEAVKEFPIPEVSIGGGSVNMKGYLVNDAGQPINESGTVVASPDYACQLYSKSYSSNPLKFNQTYNVAQPGASGYQYVKYIWNENTGTAETVPVLLQASAPIQTVWFAYKKNQQNQQYTLTYDANGGNGTVPTGGSYVRGTAVTVAGQGNLVNTGYTFIGWNTAADGTGTAYAAGSSLIMPAANVTLFARWYKGGGGSGGGGGGGGGTSTSTVRTIPPTEPALIKDKHFAYIVGYPENVVKPAGLITREEVAAVFYRLLAPDYRDSIKTASNSFADTGTNRWSSRYIGTLASGKIILGYPDGSFRPGKAITRAEIATIAAKFDKLSTPPTSKFTDVTGHWAEAYINSASEKGWVTGYPDNTFKPDKYMTRAEFVTLVNNVLGRRVHTADILPEAKQFPDLVEGAWYYEAMEEAINSHHFNRQSDNAEKWIDIYYPDLDM